MSNGPFAFDPLWMFRGPLSGDVNQRITAPWFSPSLTVNYAGDPKIEDRVVTEVASYGRQLGWLTEIVLALADKHQPPRGYPAQPSRGLRQDRGHQEISSAIRA
jgi:hypothetical protein